MGLSNSHRVLLAALAAASWLAGGLRADLAQASPFLAPNSPASAAAAGSSGPVELRGVMTTEQGTAFCIYDTAKKTSVWVGLNEPGYDFTVKSMNAANDTATVSFKGSSMQLTLRTAKVASAGPAQVPGPPNAALAPNNPAMAPNVADDQKRLDAVAAEVRRRRLEREKAYQNPGATPPQAPNR